MPGIHKPNDRVFTDPIEDIYTIFGLKPATKEDDIVHNCELYSMIGIYEAM